MNPVDALFDELERLSDEQLAGAFPIVVAMLADALGEVPPAAAPVLARFAQDVGWAQLDGEAARMDAARAWLVRHGVDARVWERLQAALEGDPTALRDAAARALGAESHARPLERTAPPPAGAVAGGPFARFALATQKTPRR